MSNLFLNIKPKIFSEHYAKVDEVSLGNGGFASDVFKVVAASREKRREQVTFAAKCVLLPKTVRERDRIDEEYRIHKVLRHVNIIELIEAFYDDRQVYFILELCEHGDLHRYLQRAGGTMAESKVAHILTQVVHAVKYLHDNRIIHRDIKPANILLVDRRAHHVKLADFGLAKRLDRTDVAQSRCGTKAYTAPEVEQGKGYGPEIDIWSIGCLVFTLLRGKPPFADTDTRDMNIERLYCNNRRVIEDRGGMLAYLEDEMATLTINCRELLPRLLQYQPEKRITLKDILAHPFLTQAEELKKRSCTDSGFGSSRCSSLRSGTRQTDVAATDRLSRRRFNSTGTPALPNRFGGVQRCSSNERRPPLPPSALSACCPTPHELSGHRSRGCSHSRGFDTDTYSCRKCNFVCPHSCYNEENLCHKCGRRRDRSLNSRSRQQPPVSPCVLPAQTVQHAADVAASRVRREEKVVLHNEKLKATLFTNGEFHADFGNGTYVRKKANESAFVVKRGDNLSADEHALCRTFYQLCHEYEKLHMHPDLQCAAPVFPVRVAFGPLSATRTVSPVAVARPSRSSPQKRNEFTLDMGNEENQPPVHQQAAANNRGTRNASGRREAMGDMTNSPATHSQQRRPGGKLDTPAYPRVVVRQGQSDQSVLHVQVYYDELRFAEFITKRGSGKLNFYPENAATNAPPRMFKDWSRLPPDVVQVLKAIEVANPTAYEQLMNWRFTA